MNQTTLFRVVIISIICVSAAAAEDPITETVKKGKKAVKKTTGVDLDRPLRSPPGPPQIFKPLGVTLPTLEHPIVPPPKSPFFDQINKLDNEVARYIANRTGSKDIRQAEAFYEKLKSEYPTQAAYWGNFLYQVIFIDRDFPHSYPPQPAKPLPNPSVELIASQDMLDSIMAEWLGEKILLGKGNWIRIYAGTLKVDKRNLLILKVTAGSVHYKPLNYPYVKGATLEIVPVIWNKMSGDNEVIMLGFRARCTDLDIKDVGEPFDMAAAHVITHFLDVAHGVGATNITQSIAKPISMGVESNKKIVPHPKKLQVYVSGTDLTIQAILDFTTQKPKVRLRWLPPS